MSYVVVPSKSVNQCIFRQKMSSYSNILYILPPTTFSKYHGHFMELLKHILCDFQNISLIC